MDTLPNITICPPSPPRPNSHFDRVQFAARVSQQPSEAHYVGHNNGINGWVSSGIAFGDYRRMSTHHSKQSGVGRHRRLETPAFMLDDKRFRSVVIRFLEFRVQLFGRQSGTERERMQRVSEHLKRKAGQAAANLDKFCAMYVAATAASDAAECKRCQQRIGEYDTTIRICREPWIIPTMAKAYYGEQLDSVGVAMRFGLKSPLVRQIMYRLGRLDAEMQAGTDIREWTRYGSRKKKRLPAAEKAKSDAVGSRQTVGNEPADASAQP